VCDRYSGTVWRDAENRCDHIRDGIFEAISKGIGCDSDKSLPEVARVVYRSRFDSWDTEGLDEEASCSVDGGYGVLSEYRLGHSWSLFVDEDGIIGIVCVVPLKIICGVWGDLSNREVEEFSP
jgi:hypothetical protein